MSDTPYIQRHTELSAAVVAFCRFLREKGFTLGPAEEADALQALTIMPLQDRETFRLLLRGVLTRSRKQQEAFDKLYEDYWKEYDRAVDAKTKDVEHESAKKQTRPNQNKPSLEALKSWLFQHEPGEEKEIAAFSPVEVLTRKDFSAFTEEELPEMMRLLNVLAKALANRFNRRFERARHTTLFDLKRTMRLNMRRGGEIVELAFRRRKRHRIRLIVLCDVSKSMDLYSRFLIQFIYAFQNVYRRIETFAFSTSLHYISPQLRQQDFGDALNELSETVPGWSGGTRIGESLQTFCEAYGRRMLDAHTMVLILSDGWETGDSEDLAEAMKFLHRKAAKVLWLNPLAGRPGYKPSTEGMRAALPYIDILLSAHNLESLKEVMRHLK